MGSRRMPITQASLARVEDMFYPVNPVKSRQRPTNPVKSRQHVARSRKEVPPKRGTSFLPSDQFDALTVPGPAASVHTLPGSAALLRESAHRLHGPGTASSPLPSAQRIIAVQIVGQRWGDVMRCFVQALEATDNRWGTRLRLRNLSWCMETLLASLPTAGQAETGAASAARNASGQKTSRGPSDCVPSYRLDERRIPLRELWGVSMGRDEQ